MSFANQVFDLGDVPAPPSGKKNVIWQADAPSTDPTVIRRVSAYVDDSGGGSSDVVVKLTTTHTLLATENVALCDGTFNVTLPVTPAQNLLYTIEVGSGVVTILPSSGLINGQSSVTGTAGYSFSMRFDGTNWRIV